MQQINKEGPSSNCAISCLVFHWKRRIVQRASLIRRSRRSADRSGVDDDGFSDGGCADVSWSGKTGCL